ncbi:MAG: hypothetical protein JWN00_2597, partial [Actinomycetia bacterium]|nr:hypothetical protein [Actinomycetes bacterium]
MGPSVGETPYSRCDGTRNMRPGAAGQARVLDASNLPSWRT